MKIIIEKQAVLAQEIRHLKSDRHYCVEQAKSILEIVKAFAHETENEDD